jgi:hypothetical protein
MEDVQGAARVTCDTHGDQPRTFVCQHIVEGLRTKTRVGFWWAYDDPENPRPDAYCTACNERVRLTDGEWTGEALDLLNAQVLCAECYDLAKAFHMGGNPWS